jgi:tetratricopeptide (TPR) repeat protein
MLAAGLALASGALAQDEAPPTDPAARIAALRAEARNPQSPTTYPITLVQLGEALLDTLATDAADTTALVALPTEAQRDRVLEFATDAAFALGRFDLAITEALERIEQAPDFADRRDLQDLRSALAVEYAEFRMPMGIARCAVLLASINDPRAGDAASVAQNGVDAVSHLDLREPLLEARRDIVYGVAALHGAVAPSLDERQPARAHFERALARDPDLAHRDPRAFVEASLGLARAVARDGRPDQALRLLDALATGAPFRRAGGEPEPAYLLMLEDARYLADQQPRDGETPAQALARAERTLAARIVQGDIGLPVQQRRALVQEKLAAMPTPALDGAPPPLLAAARARAMARDPARRDEAIALLQRTLEEHTGALSLAGAEANWRLAALLLERVRETERAGDARQALDCLIAIVRERPDFPDADAAAGAAGQLARSLLDAPGAPARADALDTLALLLDRRPDHPGADRWRLALAERTESPEARAALLAAVRPGTLERAYAEARLVDLAHGALTQATDDARTGAAEALLERFDGARAAIARAGLPPEEARALRARVGALAIDAMLVLDREDAALGLARSIADTPGAGAWSGALVAHLRRRLDSACEHADNAEVARLAPLLEDACRLRLDLNLTVDERERTRIVLAGALLAAGRHDHALALADDLLADLGRREDLLLIRADALRCLGRDSEAFPLYREVVQPLEARGAHTPAFWQAWAGMLEILARQNTDGSRTETIRREITRLRALDEDLGGPVNSRRIEAALE